MINNTSISFKVERKRHYISIWTREPHQEQKYYYAMTDTVAKSAILEPCLTD